MFCTVKLTNAILSSYSVSSSGDRPPMLRYSSRTRGARFRVQNRVGGGTPGDRRSARFPAQPDDFPDGFSFGLGLVQEGLVALRKAKRFVPFLIVEAVPGELPSPFQLFLQLRLL